MVVKILVCSLVVESQQKLVCTSQRLFYGYIYKLTPIHVERTPREDPASNVNIYWSSLNGFATVREIQ